MSLVIFHSWGLDKLKSADQYQAHSCMGLLKNKPQINADERRFIKSDEETSFLNRNSIVNSHILEINNQHQLKQSNCKLFRQISAFICVHLRLISVSLSDRTQNIQFELFPIINENDFVPVNCGILRRR